ncbi:hypothetical protein GCM10028864_13680 [Microlunatus parietis]
MLVATAPPAAAVCTGNAVVCENQKEGTPRTEWDISGVGDESIQGFATKISVNAGSRIDFKIDTDARNYKVEIYRLGYYGGDGAREVGSGTLRAALPQRQPACATDPATEIYDCGTWAISASWDVPADAVSGVYIARLIRSDTLGDSHIPFIVRRDGNTSDVLFQTADTTWQAYNTYGGSNFYQGKDNGRAYKLSYNRPFSTRGVVNGRDFLFANEYPMIRFLESNGYDVSYVSGLDTHLDPALITKHKVFLSVGHDEYWSEAQRDHVKAARDAGTNLAFFSGNEVYWKTRWEPSQDGTNTPNRTLTCYKDTWANGPIDPVQATPTWRDPRFGDLGHGPENELTGTLYQANSVDLPITVNAQEGKLRLWRNTTLGSLPSGSQVELAPHTVGYESNEDRDNGYRPTGLIRMSTTVGPTPELLQDFGNVVTPGTTTHHLTQYRAPSGALVFSAGSIQWAWGLDENHDGQVEPPDQRIRQATVNILADMGALAGTIAPDLVRSTKSTDTTKPTSTITAPADNASIPSGTMITVKGKASDVGGRIGGVEVSVDGGATWHPAEGREDYSYSGILIGRGAGAVQVRAVDDSGNLQATPTKITVRSDCPCTLFGALTPTTPSTEDATPVTLGTRFTVNQGGFITGIRFYKGQRNTGTHTGTLYDKAGAVLATATFKNESQTGWQTVLFSSAVPVTAGQELVAAYLAPNGGYAADTRFFSYRGHTSGVMTAPGGPDSPNGVFVGGEGFPRESYLQTNYYVDAIFSPTDTTPLGVTSSSPVDGETSVPYDTSLVIDFSRDVAADSVRVTLLDGENRQITGTVTRETARRFAFKPTQNLAPATRLTASVIATTTDGQPIPAPYQWVFTTAQAPPPTGSCPCTLFADTDRPADGPVNDRQLLELGIAFRSSISGVITGVRFYKAPGNAGQHQVSLWSATGSKLATAVVTNESTAGWQQANFANPVPVTKNVTYLASYTSPNGVYSAQTDGLAAPRVREPLRSDERAGRFHYGDAAPLSPSDANYYVDPVFTTDPTAKPVVQSVAPGDEARSVPTTTRVTVNFESLIQPGSAVITLTTAGGQTVPGTVAGETSNSAATFTPSDPLQPGTGYTVTVSGARSLSGVPMAASYTSTFTTSGAGACPCSLIDTSTVPVIDDSGDDRAVSLGLRFTATVDGYVSGLRYYRSAANTGDHRGSLWTADGARLASVTFAEGPPGWQTASFDTSVEITAGDEYVASYFAPNGHYAVALGYFDQPVINPPLESVGGGGVYGYDSDRFPSESWQNSHYFVDVVFRTDDTSGPAVTSVAPAADSSTAKINTAVTARFRRAIDPATLRFGLAATGGAAVSGQTTYDAETRTATFRPATALAYATSYTATVTASSAAGVAMTSPYVWKFSTTSAPPTGEEVSLFPASATPETPAWDDTDSVEVGVWFRSTVAGVVTKIKFYAGPGNTGSTVTLWAANGTPLATGTATATTTTGWREVELDTAVPITANTLYVASYRAAVGRYAVTGGQFSGGHTSGPLSVPAGGGGYRYPSGFPGTTTNTNYWVDVIMVVPQ